MKKYRELNVDLVDLERFELYPGAQQFSDEYADFAIMRLRFRFEDFNILKEAKDKLLESNLTFDEYYGVRLETEEELLNYPILFVTFGSEPGLIYEEDGIKILDKKKMGKKSIAKDFDRDIVVMEEKMKKLFEEYCKGITFYQISITNKSKKYFALGDIKESLFPPIHEGANGVEEIPHIPGNFRNIGLITHIDCHEESFEEIKAYNFTFSKHFEYKGTKYPMAAITFCVSGKFASALQKNAPNEVQISVPVLKNL